MLCWLFVFSSNVYTTKTYYMLCHFVTGLALVGELGKHGTFHHMILDSILLYNDANVYCAKQGAFVYFSILFQLQNAKTDIDISLMCVCVCVRGDSMCAST